MVRARSSPGLEVFKRKCLENVGGVENGQLVVAVKHGVALVAVVDALKHQRRIKNFKN
jgi:hypothetical protein